MASLESLPPDQRAVLQLVLQRGRSYDEIAQMLKIDRAAVRQRALAALDAIGPDTRVDPERRALITDYLLGSLPPRVEEQARELLATWPRERAWARVIASELAPLASEPLPEIPADEGGRAALEEPAAERAPETAPAREAPAVAKERKPRREKPAPRSSRLGGAILLGAGVLIAVAVVVVVLVTGGSSKSKKTSSRPANTSTRSTSTTPARVVAQINLVPPGGGSKPAGVAQVVRQGSTSGIIIVAQNVTPNTKHDAYAVWLFKPPSQAKILGFVNPGVGTNGKLQTAGGLPTDANQYTQLLVTRETQGNPKSPGSIILQGSLNLG